MKVLLTGATGYVGSAVAAALLGAGHEVTGLARHPEKAALLVGRGLQFVRGDLTNTVLLSDLAKEHDTIVHAGAATGSEAGLIDARAVDALLAGARAGRARRFVYTSSAWVLGASRLGPADEGSPVSPHPLVAHRPAVERRVREASKHGMATQVIRPGIVYGGKDGILAMWWSAALQEKLVRVVGDGDNHWPLVHLEDLAQLYLLVLEKGASGAVYHGTDDTAYPVLELARRVVRAAGGTQVQLWPLESARARFGLFADALVLDQHVLSPASRALGWAPRHPDFLKETDRIYDEFIAAPRS
jgi:nucleoside-diphosphate-sugar epimerase